MRGLRGGGRQEAALPLLSPREMSEAPGETAESPPWRGGALPPVRGAGQPPPWPPQVSLVPRLSPQHQQDLELLQGGSTLQCPTLRCNLICDCRKVRVLWAAGPSTCAADRTRERKAAVRGSPAASDRQTSAQAAPAVSSSSAAAAGEPRPRVARRPASSAGGGGAVQLSTATGGNTR